MRQRESQDNGGFITLWFLLLFGAGCLAQVINGWVVLGVVCMVISIGGEIQRKADQIIDAIENGHEHTD